MSAKRDDDGGRTDFVRLQDQLKARTREIQQALPAGMSANRFLRAVWGSIRANPRLVEVERSSLMSAVMQLAQVGLIPDSPLRHAYLRPTSSGARIILGYRGIIAMALRSPAISFIEAHVVYTSDHFDYRHGTDQYLHHRVSEASDARARGDLRCAYARAQLANGDSIFHVSPRWEIMESMKRSEDHAEADSPWQTDVSAMWRKTPIRRLEPFLPLTASVAQVLATDDRPIEHNAEDA